MVTKFYTPRHWTLAEKLAHYSMPVASGCRVWQGAHTPKGYGHVRWKGRTVEAHRAAWTVVHGAIPAKMHVCHTCDTPACISVQHLWLGTNADNVADKIAKGRARYAHGAKSGNAKLTDASAMAIFSSTMTHKEIAAAFGVTTVTVRNIKSGNHWRHLHR